MLVSVFYVSIENSIVISPAALISYVSWGMLLNLCVPEFPLSKGESEATGFIAVVRML